MFLMYSIILFKKCRVSTLKVGMKEVEPGVVRSKKWGGYPTFLKLDCKCAKLVFLFALGINEIPG